MACRPQVRRVAQVPGGDGPGSEPQPGWRPPCVPGRPGVRGAAPDARRAIRIRPPATLRKGPGVPAMRRSPTRSASAAPAVVPHDAITGVPAEYTPTMIRRTPVPMADIATTDDVPVCRQDAPRRVQARYARVIESPSTLICLAASGWVAGPLLTLPVAASNLLP